MKRINLFVGVPCPIEQGAISHFKYVEGHLCSYFVKHLHQEGRIADLIMHTVMYRDSTPTPEGKSRVPRPDPLNFVKNPEMEYHFRCNSQSDQSHQKVSNRIFALIELEDLFEKRDRFEVCNFRISVRLSILGSSVSMCSTELDMAGDTVLTKANSL